MTRLRNVRYRQWVRHLNRQNRLLAPLRVIAISPAWVRGRWWPDTRGRTETRLQARRRLMRQRDY